MNAKIDNLLSWFKKFWTIIVAVTSGTGLIVWKWFNEMIEFVTTDIEIQIWIIAVVFVVGLNIGFFLCYIFKREKSKRKQEELSRELNYFKVKIPVGCEVSHKEFEIPYPMIVIGHEPGGFVICEKYIPNKFGGFKVADHVKLHHTDIKPYGT